MHTWREKVEREEIDLRERQRERRVEKEGSREGEGRESVVDIGLFLAGFTRTFKLSLPLSLSFGKGAIDSDRNGSKEE